MIGPRGYANVVKSETRSKLKLEPGSEIHDGSGEDVGSAEEAKVPDEVYGLLYVLDEEDEKALDIAEGVPDCYVKMMLGVEAFGGDEMGNGVKSNEVEVLVYVDVARTGIGVCKEEYVARMNRGITDAVERGMPQSYVDRVLRKWVRDEDVPRDGDVEDPFFPGRK